MATELPAVPFGDATPKLAMIDIAKGIGIFLIVVGHNSIFAASNGAFGDFLKAFRLPFFFFISGVTFSVGKRTLGEVALHRADAWLKPFVVVVILLGMRKVWSGHGDMEAIALGLTFATGFALNPVAVWFLPHLWLLYVFCTALLTLDRRLLDTPVKRGLLLLTLLCAGYGLMNAFANASVLAECRHRFEFTWALFNCGLPFSADLLLLTASFFLLGNFLSARVKAFRVQPMIMLGCAAVLLSIQLSSGYTVDLNFRRYDHLVLCTVQALCGIYLMLCFCVLITKAALLPKILRYLGRASLFILLFHQEIMFELLPRLLRRTDSRPLAAVVSIVAALVISALLWELCKRNKIASMIFLPIKWKHRQAKAPLAPVAS